MVMSNQIRRHIIRGKTGTARGCRQEKSFPGEHMPRCRSKSHSTTVRPAAYGALLQPTQTARVNPVVAAAFAQRTLTASPRYVPRGGWAGKFTL